MRPEVQSPFLPTEFPSPRDAVESRLSRTGHPQLSRVQVSDIDGRIQLTGVVRTYYVKQLAQTAALTVPGVNEVENAIIVK